MLDDDPSAMGARGPDPLGLGETTTRFTPPSIRRSSQAAGRLSIQVFRTGPRPPRSPILRGRAPRSWSTWSLAPEVACPTGPDLPQPSSDEQRRRSGHRLRLDLVQGRAPGTVIFTRHPRGSREP